MAELLQHWGEEGFEAHVRTMQREYAGRAAALQAAAQARSLLLISFLGSLCSSVACVWQERLACCMTRRMLQCVRSGTISRKAYASHRRWQDEHLLFEHSTSRVLQLCSQCCQLEYPPPWAYRIPFGFLCQKCSTHATRPRWQRGGRAEAPEWLGELDAAGGRHVPVAAPARHRVRGHHPGAPAGREGGGRARRARPQPGACACAEIFKLSAYQGRQQHSTAAGAGLQLIFWGRLAV